jgi:hypothetical protein
MWILGDAKGMKVKGGILGMWKGKRRRGEKR